MATLFLNTTNFCSYQVIKAVTSELQQASFCIPKLFLQVSQLLCLLIFLQWWKIKLQIALPGLTGYLIVPIIFEIIDRASSLSPYLSPEIAYQFLSLRISPSIKSSRASLNVIAWTMYEITCTKIIQSYATELWPEACCFIYVWYKRSRVHSGQRNSKDELLKCCSSLGCPRGISIQSSTMTSNTAPSVLRTVVLKFWHQLLNQAH